jgi:hypothetical protein
VQARTKAVEGEREESLREPMGSTRVAMTCAGRSMTGATLHVRSYDTINRSDRPVLGGDISFYLDLARRAGRDVLEVGIGTGRHRTGEVGDPGSWPGSVSGHARNRSRDGNDQRSYGRAVTRMQRHAQLRPRRC